MRHGGDVLVEMLIGYGVPVVFGLAGGQTLPLYDAIRSRAPRIKHIPMRDERNAAYAADGYARISGRVGVCDATVGPGAIKLTSGLAEAYNSSIPIVALVSDMPSDWLAVRYRGGGNQLVDQMSVLAPLCKCTVRLPASHKLPELVQRAIQISTSGRPGPVAIELPEDMFRAAYDGISPAVDARYGVVPPHRFAPDLESVRAAIALLASATHPVMIVGGGARLSNAGEQVSALAEALAIPVATTLSGKGILPETHPLSLGVIGSLGGSSVAQKFLEGADVILAVGFKFGQNPTFRWTLPKQGQRVVQLDIDGAEIGKVFPAEVGLVADAREGLAALRAACTVNCSTEAITKQIAELKTKWREQVEIEAGEAKPIKPQQVALLLNGLCDEDTILVCDASFAGGWGGIYYEIRGSRRAIFPRGLGGLGWGLPAAIGAQVARPKSKVVVLAGDGAMTYSLGELATLVQQGMNITVVVMNNSAMGWIKWEQAVFWDGKFVSTDLSDVNFAMVARGMGCTGMNVTEPAELHDVLSQALISDKPTLVDVRTAVSEAAVPKFTESAQARKLMEAG
ncbi:MAG TPA: thiamine pyrophosphate-binding protein [Anaerolineales bacterium]|nr:thiamine pyrophosphate-binding protein [Anaerolineales bacterium]